MHKKVKYTVFLAGLAVAGGGAYVITDQVSGRDTATTSPETAPYSPAASPVMPSVTTTGAEPEAAKKAVPSSPPMAAAPTISLGAEAYRRLAAAKEAGKNDVKVQRALPQPVVTSALQRWEEGSVSKEGKMLRVVSARQDLTGYGELAWIADEGRRVGNARCSQRLRMSNEQEPRVRPTMVICWRLSPARSVYSLLIDVKNKPSMQESVARIDKTWAQMG